NPMELEVGEEYEEPGATAEDDVNDLTEEIDIDNSEVDTDVAGEYTVTYTVSNEVGEATETRTVIVVDPYDDQDPEEEALQAVNDAESPEAMWDALENEELGLNLQAVENYNTYRKMKIAEHILENRPEEGFEVGGAG